MKNIIASSQFRFASIVLVIVPMAVLMLNGGQRNLQNVAPSYIALFSLVFIVGLGMFFLNHALRSHQGIH